MAAALSLHLCEYRVQRSSAPTNHCGQRMSNRHANGPIKVASPKPRQRQRTSSDNTTTHYQQHPPNSSQTLFNALHQPYAIRIFYFILRSGRHGGSIHNQNHQGTLRGCVRLRPKLSWRMPDQLSHGVRLTVHAVYRSSAISKGIRTSVRRRHPSPSPYPDPTARLMPL